MESYQKMILSLQAVTIRLQVQNMGYRERTASGLLMAVSYTHLVYDGQSALDYLEADNYDGVVLDIMMPKVDGLTVLRKVRERGNLIPILLLTAKSEVDDKVEGLDAGANDYLAKPFHSKELLARIRAITRAQTAQANSKLKIHHW